MPVGGVCTGMTSERQLRSCQGSSGCLKSIDATGLSHSGPAFRKMCRSVWIRTRPLTRNSNASCTSRPRRDSTSTLRKEKKSVGAGIERRIRLRRSAPAACLQCLCLRRQVSPLSLRLCAPHHRTVPGGTFRRAHSSDSSTPNFPPPPPASPYAPVCFCPCAWRRRHGGIPLTTLCRRVAEISGANRASGATRPAFL